MGDSDEYKWAMRVVIKRQLRDLLQQLHDHGDEIAVMSINMEESTYCHFGSSYGEWFVSEEKGMLPRFLKFCLNQRKQGIKTKRNDDPSTLRLDSPPRKTTPAVGRGGGKLPVKKSESTPKKTVSLPTITVATRSTRSGKRPAPSSPSPAKGSPGPKKKLAKKSEKTVGEHDPIHVSGDEANTVDKACYLDREALDGVQGDGMVAMGKDYDEDAAISDEENVSGGWDNDDDPFLEVMDQIKPPKRDPHKVSNTKMKKLQREPRYRSLKEKTPMECDECGKLIRGPYNLTVHKDRMHKMVRNAQCKICSKWFFANANLEYHMLSVHTRQCVACEQYVVETVAWTEGMSRKTRRDVVCSCGALVAISSKVGRKARVLMNDESEPEEDPDLAPKPKSATKYACGACGKIFHKRADCENHSKMHMGVKTFACELCDNRYQTQGGLNHHMVNTHGIVGEVCNICGKNFSSEQRLLTHISRYHSDPSAGPNQPQGDAMAEEDGEEEMGEEEMGAEDMGTEATSDSDKDMMVIGNK